MYTLDTNAVIYYLKNDTNAVSVLEGVFAEDVPLYVSTITELELFGFSSLTASEADHIEQVLQTLSVIPVDSQIARLAGMVRRMHNIKTADSAIAATALFTKTTLLTRNIADFKKIESLSLKEI